VHSLEHDGTTFNPYTDPERHNRPTLRRKQTVRLLRAAVRSAKNHRGQTSLILSSSVLGLQKVSESVITSRPCI